MSDSIAAQIAIIPEGYFWMGSDDGHDNEKPRHRVWLSRFGLAKYPVTNKQYALFLNDTGSRPPPFWLEPLFSHPEQPVVGATWHDAVAYCTWLSASAGQIFRLPTEAEWERAARGNKENAAYPWGDAPPSDRPYSGYNVDTGGPNRVGINEPNDFGLYDMSEGVHEWCSDWYNAAYYHHSPIENPVGAATGSRRASRGGSWRHHVKFSRCAARSSLPPGFAYADYGFRVALALVASR
jgi:formylglycine-generating enzyme required for sulfatase activity